MAILRGLKERYEVFHGVKITDQALIAAAKLSDRYISDRFLPDKAIDLVDEACAMIRTEIDSMPQEMDDIARQIIEKEIEEARSPTTHRGALEREARQGAGRACRHARQVQGHEGQVGNWKSRTSAKCRNCARRLSSATPT